MIQFIKNGHKFCLVENMDESEQLVYIDSEDGKLYLDDTRQPVVIEPATKYHNGYICLPVINNRIKFWTGITEIEYNELRQRNWCNELEIEADPKEELDELLRLHYCFVLQEEITETNMVQYEIYKEAKQAFEQAKKDFIEKFL